MILKFWIFYNRLYVNETIVVYSLKNNQLQNSIATIKHATKDNLKDILYFQHEKYLDVFKNFLYTGDKGYLGYLENNCIHRS